MSYCPVTDTTTTAARPAAPAALTVSPPNTTGDVCDTTVKQNTVTSGSSGASSTTTIPGPPGPAGPAGPAGPTGPQGPAGTGGGSPHAGMRWMGTWTLGQNYFEMDADTPVHADVIKIDGGVYVCIADHEATEENRPRASTYEGETTWTDFWDMIVVPVSGDSVKWSGGWEADKNYYAADPAVPRNADMVSIDNSSFICIEDHLSDDLNMPRPPDYLEPTDWPRYWAINSRAPDEEKTSFIDGLSKGPFDWMKKLTVGDWLKYALIGAGILVAGALIASAFSDDGSGEGGEDPDSRYNGTPSWTGAYTPPSLRVVVQSLCMEGGIENYDVSLLSNTDPCQFVLSTVTSIRNILDNMSRAFQFDMVDSSGVLKFVPRTNVSVRTLTYDDMAFTETGETISPVTIKRLQSIDLPRSVSLTYIAEDLDYNNFTQRSELPTFELGNDMNISIPFMISHERAKSATERILIGAHLERMQYSFKTSYRNAVDLEPGDIITIPDGAARIMQIEEVEDGILEITCADSGIVGPPTAIVLGGVTIGYTASTYIGTESPPSLPSEPKNAAPVITRAGALFIDPPALNSADVEPRVYAAIHGYGVEGWPGAQLFRSIDGGATYTLIGSSNKSASWGLVSTAIGTASPYVWDDTTVITVQMKTGELVSRTDAAVLAGENLCLVGAECIAYGVATLISPGVYQLSHLLRGRRGTEYATGTHVANELFMLLNENLVEIKSSETDRGKTYKYKVVTYGSDLTKVDATDVQIWGNNTIPWSPVQVKGTRLDNVWTINWIERPRWNNTLINYTEIPHDPDWGGFVVVIYSGTTEVRREIVFDTTFVYTSAAQVADFGSNQATLRVGVVQISNKYGGGQQTIVNI